ncbi:ATP-binding protein [Pseudomonas sp. PDM13]|uniref:ATP-binding protein n=1 Tax=Pseudomonas sp. PDM13 TaxID=2769255 RepID=UPI0021E0DDF5|nr:ATP-binding protein [Pseudomonas sp. PDM13]MCU9947646.1 SpoIIE family protein phosphatase [Pseudomonas sp. PDM13]
MEVIPSCHLLLEVSDSAHVDAVRRTVVRHASQLTRDETLLGRLTVVVQEMARNLINHAGQGELLFRCDEAGLEVTAVDRGPGMTNVAQCLSDNYSTTGTMGAGLGAIQRMSDGFDLFSQPGLGTVVQARFHLGPRPAAGALQVGAVCTPYPGETLSGDAWAVLGNRVLVCDGLGHGHAASAASQKAREVFLGHDPHMPLQALMEQLHRALMSTRGGAAAIAEVQPAQRQVQFCGIGNIAGSLLTDKARSMASSNGTVGYRIGRIHTFSYPWDDSSIMILASDGISTKLDLNAYPGLRVRHPGVIAALIHRDHKRLNDDATVVVVKHG